MSGSSSLPNGTYYIRVTASNAGSSSTSDEVRFDVGSVQPSASMRIEFLRPTEVCHGAPPDPQNWTCIFYSFRVREVGGFTIRDIKISHRLTDPQGRLVEPFWRYAPGQAFLYECFGIGNLLEPQDLLRPHSEGCYQTGFAVTNRLAITPPGPWFLEVILQGVDDSGRNVTAVSPKLFFPFDQHPVWP